MTNSKTQWLMIAGLSVAGAVFGVGCGSSSTPASGTGGAGGSAATGTGGHAVVDAAPTVHVFRHTFDTAAVGVDGFVFNNGYGYTGTTDINLAPPPAAAGDAAAADAGSATPPTITWDDTVGDGGPGSLKIAVTFTACNQFVEPALVVTPVADLTGKTVSAKMQLTSGMFSGGAQLYLQTDVNYGGYTKAGYTLPTTAAPTGFATASINLAIPPAMMEGSAALMPSQVIHVGVKIFSGYAPTCVEPYANAGVPVVFNLDTFTD